MDFEKVTHTIESGGTFRLFTSDVPELVIHDVTCLQISESSYNIMYELEINHNKDSAVVLVPTHDYVLMTFMKGDPIDTQ